MTSKSFALLAIALLAAAAPLAAQTAPAAPTVESRLREQLKSMSAQIRTAETEKATLQTEKVAVEEKAKKLAADIEKLGKDFAAERDVAKKDIEKATVNLAGKEAELAQVREELAKATSFGTQSAALAKKNGDERTKLAAENVQLKRVVADQRVKNGKMFEIAGEILTRYQKFGLGTALTAREPFVGVTRARIETMVEEYGGKVAEQRINAVGNSKPPAAQEKAPATASAKVKRPKD